MDNVHEDLPADLARPYELFILPGPDAKKESVNMRDIKSDTIGSLVTFRGIVVKITDVKPAAVVVAYSCEVCGYELYQTVSGREFTPLNECNSKICRKNNVKGKLFI